MKTLTEIIKKTGHTDKDSTHNYCWVYDYWFNPLRDNKMNILEVGVAAFGGGDLLAMVSYFPNATIYGVDINMSPCLEQVFKHPRIKLIECDAYNPNILKYFKDIQFQIILDDGSHEIFDQINLFKMLSPYLTDTGFYTIEDCCTNHWLSKLPVIWELGFKHTLIDQTTKNHYDSTLIRFDKCSQ